jgi:exopolysaccharide biosynthesis polyprenyl glycosylphosphotransferase
VLSGTDQQDAHSVSALLDVVRRRDIHEIIVGSVNELSPAVQSTLVELAEQGVTVLPASRVHESLTGRVVPSALSCLSLGPMSPSAHLYGAAKRLVDLTVAAVGLLLIAPLLLVLAVGITLDSPGAPLYWQERVGRYGRRFWIVKLRTMIQDAEIDGRAVWAQESDPRVTRLGVFLRRTRLDELPQLWNVLRGEMSLIGPRPERPSIVESLIEEIPMFRARHVVAPGITGWAQVQYRYGSSVADAATKLQYDLYYIRHRSPFLDAIILLKTAAVVLGCKGR